MKVIVNILVSVTCMVLVSSIASRLPIDVFKPDFAIPLIIYVTFFVSPGFGMLATLCAGLAGEVLSSAPTGSILFINMSIFLVAVFMTRQIYLDSKYSFAAACGGGVILESFLFLLLSVLGKGETGNISVILFYAVPNAIFTGFISIFIYSLFGRMSTRYLDEEQ